MAAKMAVFAGLNLKLQENIRYLLDVTKENRTFARFVFVCVTLRYD